MRERHFARLVGGSLLLAVVGVGRQAWTAPNDWAEGVGELNDGATRDFYNRAASLPWQQQLGDWRDSTGLLHGTSAYASAPVDDTDTPRSIEWDATNLVQQWVDAELQNEGFFLHALSGGGPIVFASRESATEAARPVLEVQSTSGTQTLSPTADTYLEPSTYQDMGNGDELRVSGDNNVLLRFDLSGLAGEAITSATLRLFTSEQYGSTDIGLFRVAAGRDGAPPAFEAGLAADFDHDAEIASHGDVIFFEDFEAEGWEEHWTAAYGTFDTIDEDAALELEPLSGRALRVLMPGGSNDSLSLEYGFADKTGSEPSEIYFRYYLRLASDWNQTVDGGKMPGIAGTYGVAGWGGRPSDGTNGWSSRGSYSLTIPEGNPLAGFTPLGNYVYHADMEGQYGDIFIWNQSWGVEGFGGLLPRNHWYCVEQYLSMNTLSVNDGVLRTWIDGRLAYEKTDVRFRDVATLLIEEIWLNIYHGGTAVSPYDQHLFIDNVVVAARYVGPMGPVEITDAGPGWDDGGDPPPQPDSGTGEPPGNDDAEPIDDSGCGCSLPGRPSRPALLGILLLPVVLRSRRR